MSRWPKRLAVGICLLGGVLVSSLALAANVPTLWGVDEDDGMLFSIADYETLSGLTEYGTLKFDDSGTLRSIGRHIEAFTLDVDSTAYMAVNHSVGSISHDRLNFSINPARAFSGNLTSSSCAAA